MAPPNRRPLTQPSLSLGNKRPAQGTNNQPPAQRNRVSSSQEAGPSRPNQHVNVNPPNSNSQYNPRNVPQLSQRRGHEPPPNTPDSTQPEEIIEDVEMPLTGSAQGQGNTGSSMANKDCPIYAPERPLTIFGRKTTTYRKVHRFLTAGVAHRLLTDSNNAGILYLTTPLAAIPWDIPLLYMNPSEFALLPSGAHATQCRIRIVHRGTRIAFETASSTNGLATLNQIHNIMVAEGLNKTGWGINRLYNFDATAPMIPSITNPASAFNQAYLYGVQQTPDADAIDNNNLPCSQIGWFKQLVNYWTATSLRTATNVSANSGWPALQKQWQFYDGKTTVNEEILNKTWDFNLAPLTAPLPHLRETLPYSPLTIPVNGNLVGGRTAGIALSGSAAEAAESNTTVTNTWSTVDFSYNAPMEKSQFIRSGLWGQHRNPQIQPSVHVGVQAVPALTTVTGETAVQKFTDTQAYWDVFCELDVVEHLPTEYAYAPFANVPAGDIMVRTTTATVGNELTTVPFAGLYPVEVNP